jgi:hypothetical protein
LHSPPIKVWPLRLRGDPSVIAEFVGQEWPVPNPQARASERKRQGCLYWGILKRQPSGALAVGEITVVPLVPDALTSPMLRSVSLERILERARAEIRDSADWLAVARDLGWQLPPEKEIRKIERLAAEVEKTRRSRGRRRKSPAVYHAFALEALELQANGVGRGMRRMLAKKHNVEVGTVRDWLRRCRDLGFLAPAEWGKTGVAPGPNLTEEER